MRPERIVICGQPFSVEWVTPGPLEDSADLGATNVDLQRIAINAKDLGAFAERDTVIHEVLHGLVRLTGHQETFSGKKQEEQIIKAVSSGLLAVLRGNPELVAWLTEE